MNQFFYNIATTTWALKHFICHLFVIDIIIWYYDFIDLFVIDYKVLTLQGEKNKGSYCLAKNMSQSVEQQLNENALSGF